jgi:hypothetical protein
LNYIFQGLKEITVNLDYCVLCPEKLSFIIEGEIKNFHDKEKLKELMPTKPALKTLKGILHTKEQIFN